MKTLTILGKQNPAAQGEAFFPGIPTRPRVRLIRWIGPGLRDRPGASLRLALSLWVP